MCPIFVTNSFFIKYISVLKKICKHLHQKYNRKIWFGVDNEKQYVIRHFISDKRGWLGGYLPSALSAVKVC